MHKSNGSIVYKLHTKVSIIRALGNFSSFGF